MKISYNWLKQYLAMDLPAEKTGELLTDSGLEIEGIEIVDQIPGGLKGLVIGEVMSCEKHPNADRLNKTTVNIGETELLSIVCGAPNVAKGQKVVIATVGATLYPNNGEPFEIKKSKIRGELSQGMICAEDEIGLGESHDGIMVLDGNAIVGTPAASHFKIEQDQIFEIGLTPNRADAMSHYGVARDLAVVLNRFGLEHGELKLPEVSNYKSDNTSSPITIEVKDTHACSRYVGICIEGIEVKPSPEWLQKRLASIGLKPINNIVDTTNFVLHELGQPLHAFDSDKIAGNKLIVGQLPEKTKFKTLDGNERQLSDKDLMICNEKEGMCIAGIFGGLESGVSENTKNIFLESAYFNPVSVRKTAKRHGLNTDASFRFERGIDPEITVFAAKRAAMIIKEIAGGKITSDILESYPTKLNGFNVSFSYSHCDRLIGKAIDHNLIKSILTDLEIEIKSETENGLELYVPAFKVDVQREADVIEEILRVYGYNEIELPQKMHISLTPSLKPQPEQTRNAALNFLANNGLNEMMSNSLTKAGYYPEGLSAAVEILNPLSKDLEVMRQSMLFSGLETIAYNQNRNEADLKLFEFGKTYQQYSDGNKEEQHISVFLTGNKTTENWNSDFENQNFFTLKGLLEGLFKKLGVDDLGVQSKESKNEELDFGIQLSIQKLKVAEFGSVSLKSLKQFGIKNEVVYADINWDNLFELVKRSSTKYQETAKYPSVRRDLALVVDKETGFESLKTIALNCERQILKEVGIFDVYEGKDLENGKKSYAMSFRFRDENKTLTDKVVDKSMKRIYDQLEKQGGAKLRSGEI